MTLCNPVNCSTPGFPILLYLLEFAQTHVHWVDDAIQPFSPLLPASPPVLSLSQNQGLSQWVGSLHDYEAVSAPRPRKQADADLCTSTHSTLQGPITCNRSVAQGHSGIRGGFPEFAQQSKGVKAQWRLRKYPFMKLWRARRARHVCRAHGHCSWLVCWVNKA